MRTIYFVWKVTFRLIINPNRIHCFAVWCLMLFLTHIHTHTHTHTHAGAQTGRMAFDWMVALVKSQRKDVSRSLRVCVWERLAGLHRWNVWFSGSVRGESGWDLKWNQSCITATEVLSQYYSSSSSRGGGSVAPKVQFYQYLLKDVTFNFPVLEGYCLFEFCFSLFIIVSAYRLIHCFAGDFLCRSLWPIFKNCLKTGPLLVMIKPAAVLFQTLRTVLWQLKEFFQFINDQKMVFILQNTIAAVAVLM